MKIFSGFTNNTGKKLLLDAGAYFKNYDIATDTFESAVVAGKLIGATRGGGEFKAIPEIRQIDVDGIKGKAKGLEVIDSWDVSIQANVLEVTPDTLKLALGIAVIDTITNTEYDIVTAKNSIEDADYLDNITWVGQLSGSGKPVIIQVLNTLNLEGLTLATAPKGEAVTTMTFAGHYTQDDLDTPPFKIYYPKVIDDTTPPTVTVSPVDESTGVAVSTDIVWTFSEAIQASSVANGNFMVYKDGGTLVSGTLSQSPDKTIVTFSPDSDLSAATLYTAIATTNVKDINGNALATNEITNFTTA